MVRGLPTKEGVGARIVVKLYESTGELEEAIPESANWKVSCLLHRTMHVRIMPLEPKDKYE